MGCGASAHVGVTRRNPQDLGKVEGRECNGSQETHSMEKLKLNTGYGEICRLGGVEAPSSYLAGGLVEQSIGVMLVASSFCERSTRGSTDSNI